MPSQAKDVLLDADHFRERTANGTPRLGKIGRSPQSSCRRQHVSGQRQSALPKNRFRFMACFRMPEKLFSA
jgi:hypothetical protein